MLQFGASLTKDTSSVNYDRNMFTIQATGGSAKANRRELKTCLGQFFNSKLGCYDYVNILIYVDTRPSL